MEQALKRKYAIKSVEAQCGGSGQNGKNDSRSTPDTMAENGNQQKAQREQQQEQAQQQAAPRFPSTITSCNSGTCFDNMGRSYSGSQGFYIGTDGKSCQSIGRMMHCN
jgi:hypothetical protein